MPKAVLIEKDPFDVALSLQNVTLGKYRIVHSVDGKNFETLTNLLGLSNKGECLVDLTVDITMPIVQVVGQISYVLERECGKTLTNFMEKKKIQVSDTFDLNDAEDIEELEYFTEKSFSLGAYVQEQMVMGLTPFPQKGKKKEGVLVSDGLDETVKMEKNPFSVLKQLKS